MTVRQVASPLARVLFVLVWILSFSYGLIAYVPFTYTQVIEARLSEPLLQFAVFHAWFVWAAVVCAVAALWPRVVRRDIAASAFVVAMAVVAVGLTVHPLLASLRNEPRSLWIGLSMLLPVFALAAIDSTHAARRITWVDAHPSLFDARLWWSCLSAALFVWLLFTGLALWHGGAGLLVDQLRWSLPAHLTIFAAAFTVMMLISSVALWRRKRSLEFVLALLGVFGAIWWFIATIIFGALSFSGRLADLSAGLTAAAIVGAWCGIALVMRAEAGGIAASGFDVLLAPSDRKRSPLALGIWLVALGAGGTFLVVNMAAMDWNFLGQKAIAATLWVIATTVIYGAVTARKPGAGAGIALACAAPVLFGFVITHLDAAGGNRITPYDVSYRLVNDAIVPVVDAGSADAGDLYKVLLANTNLPRERKVDALDVELAGALSRSTRKQPNIFMVVVDSLRRDYVAPFNPAVTFTPRIAGFAQDGVAFTNAFTRYGATGLSEPSIWVGGMMLHKQYVTPFAPQNSLAKLIDAEGYTPIMSVDTVLHAILPAQVPRLIEIDRGRATKDLDLCQSLPELTNAIATATASGTERLFSYTQPQNVHISTITRENASVVGGGSYPGFYAPYASRLQRIDACFGNFVDALKASGQYDNSIVIFTADHGDSLGEDGRFGHAYTVYPEVMRIPLIIKLPGDQSPIAPNKDAMVFSTDITPTLFELLGHPPTLSGFPFGRSLVVPAGGRAIRRDAGELVASSYGAVYGLLEQNGTRLYISDAVNFQDYVYDLTKGFVGARTTATPAERDAARKSILDGVAAIAKTYHFTAR